MKFIKFSGEFESSDPHQWNPVTKIVPINSIMLNEEPMDGLTKTTSYFIIVNHWGTTKRYRTSQFEYDRIANILLKEPDPVEEILHRAVKNAIQKLRHHER